MNASPSKPTHPLLETAIGLFAQKGFTGTTCKDIAEAADVTKAMIFRYFDSKEDLYNAILTYKMEQRESEFRAILNQAARQHNDRAVFKTLATHILSGYLRDPVCLRLLVYSGLEGHPLATDFMMQEETPLNQFLVDYIRQRIREKAFRRVNPSVAARAFFGMVCNHALVQVLFQDPILQITPEQAADGFADIFLQGILNRTSNGKSDTRKTKLVISRLPNQ